MNQLAKIKIKYLKYKEVDKQTLDHKYYFYMISHPRLFFSDRCTHASYMYYICTQGPNSSEQFQDVCLVLFLLSCYAL